MRTPPTSEPPTPEGAGARSGLRPRAPSDPRRRAMLAALGAAPLVAALPAAHGTGPVPAAPLEEVPYVQTPQPVVDAILQLAELRAGDLLFDLGSGDGRIVIEAARRFGVQALGIEIDPALVRLSNERALQAGVAHRVRFVAQDLFETDLRPATVVTMYLLPDVNLALRPRLLALAPGTRLVSHDWDMGDWAPQRSVTVDAPDKPVGLARRSTVHRWTVPARVDGAWQGTLDVGQGPQRFTLAIAQRFDGLWLEGQAQGQAQGQGQVNGTHVQLSAWIAGQQARLEGAIDADRMTGLVQMADRRGVWRAQRLP